MKKRALDMLRYFFQINRSHCISLDSFARDFGVSEKTIRNDIDDINYFFRDIYPNNIIFINKSHFAGLEAGVDLEGVSWALYNMEAYQYLMTAQERIIYSLVKILCSDKPFKIIDFMSETKVSRATICTDLTSIKSLLEYYGLKHYSDNLGLHIEASEYKRRLIICELLEKHYDIFDEFSVYPRLLYAIVFKTVDIKRIESFLEELLEEKDLLITKGSVYFLALYIYVALNRIAQGCKLSWANNTNMIKAEDEFLLAAIDKKIQSSLNIRLNRNEIYGIGFYLKKKGISWGTGHTDTCSKRHFYLSEFIRAISKRLGVNFNTDYTLFKNLSSLLSKKMEKQATAISDIYPFKAQMCERYPEIIDSVYDSKHLIENYLSFKFDENEILLIATHFSNQMEIYLKRLVINNVYVACPSNVVTGQLLATFLEKEFNISVKGVFSKSDFYKKRIEGIDFIVSTYDLNIDTIPVVVVSPFLDAGDKRKIRQMLVQRGSVVKETAKDNDTDITDSVNYIQSNLYNDSDKTAFQGEINQTVKKYLQKIIEAKTSYKIGDQLANDLVSIVKEDTGWRKAIEYGCDLLKDNGYVDSVYYHMIVKKVEEHGPYFVIKNGIALSHAPPGTSVKKLGLSLVVFPLGVCFGHPENDPVFLLFTFCTNQEGGYLELLQNLMDLTNKEALIPKLISSEDKSALLEAIRQLEK